MKLLQPYHAEVRHAVSVSVKVRRHRVSVSCAYPRKVQQVSLVERVAGLPDINVCLAPLTKHRYTPFKDLQSTLFLTVYLLLAASSNESASTMYGLHISARRTVHFWLPEEHFVVFFCALKCHAGWHLL